MYTVASAEQSKIRCRVIKFLKLKQMSSKCAVKVIVCVCLSVYNCRPNQANFAPPHHHHQRGSRGHKMAAKPKERRKACALTLLSGTTHNQSDTSSIGAIIIIIDRDY